MVDNFWGRGPSPGALKQIPQIFLSTANLLGKLLKEFGAFRAVEHAPGNEQRKRPKFASLSIFCRKVLIGLI